MNRLRLFFDDPVHELMGLQDEPIERGRSIAQTRRPRSQPEESLHRKIVALA
jgi:hypothetical protein